MTRFKKLEETQQFVPHVQTSISDFRKKAPGAVKIVPGTIVCLYLNKNDELQAHWLDDSWTFKFPVEQIIADLDDELPSLLHQFELTGDIHIVLGELADDTGALSQAFGCSCNVEEVLSVKV